MVVISGIDELVFGELVFVVYVFFFLVELYGNDFDIEMVWVMRVMQYVEVYYKLILLVDLQFLKFIKVDD